MGAQAKTLVLVADDDPIVRRVVERVLGAPDRMILTAGNGEEALRIARSLRPSLIILDVLMPGLSGHEVCRALRAQPEMRAIAILMLTGLCAVRDEVEGLDMGADDYLAKPFDAAQLNARADALLRGRCWGRS